MKLRIKIPLLILAASFSLILILYFILGGYIVKGYSELEENLALKDVDRIYKALDGEVKQLANSAGDYAFWDNTYDFAVTKSSAYIDENFYYSSMQNLGVYAFLIVNKKGEFVYGKVAVDSTESLADPDSSLLREFLTNPSVWLFKEGDFLHSGIIMVNGLPVMFGSASIHKNERLGASRGAVIFAKQLDSDMSEKLSEITSLQFSIEKETVSEGKNVSSTRIEVLSSDTLVAYSAVNDFNGKKVLEIRLPLYREIVDRAKVQVNYFLVLLIVLAIGFAATVIVLMELFVIGRLNVLARDIRIIRQRKRTESRVTVKGRDELAGLGTTINEMLSSIESSGREITESEKKFRLAFENAKDPFFWIDCSDLSIININKAAEVLLGKSRNAVIGNSLDTCFPANRTKEYNELFGLYAAKNDAFDAEIEIQSSDSLRIVNVSGSTTTLAGQQVIQAVFQDITKERESEREKHQLEEQLRQAQKMEVVGQLAGGIAHDFNNMLSGISGYSDLIMKKYGEKDADLAKYAGIIHSTAASAADVTAKLLAFARKGKNEVSRIELNAVVDDVMKLMEHTSDRKVKVVFSERTDLATVIGDRSQVQNAILNLAMNSIDAMPNGGELIFVTENVDIDENYVKTHPYKISVGRYVKLVVQDNGMGMDSKVKARLFEPFFTTKGVGKGTGLGLASVYGTMKSHNGSVTVYSEIGKGTAFNLYFPYASDPSTEAAAAIQKVIRGTGNILVIDDENIVRNAATDILTELGYSVETAKDGLEGIRVYKENWQKYDAVILDIIMPNLGGADTFNELKKINPEIRALICSGYAMNAVAAKILESGAKGFTQKPFDVTKLSKAIAEVLSA
ncbi:MAG: response regulator [Fibrobacteres bacterium]|nr:response regulator [Fibrobacterota bacterium]